MAKKVSEECVQLLTENLVSLSNGMSTDRMVTELDQAGVITLEMKNTIKAESDKQKKNEMIIDYLRVTGTQKQVDDFLQCLFNIGEGHLISPPTFYISSKALSEHCKTTNWFLESSERAKASPDGTSTTKTVRPTTSKNGAKSTTNSKRGASTKTTPQKRKGAAIETASSAKKARKEGAEKDVKPSTSSSHADGAKEKTPTAKTKKGNKTTANSQSNPAEHVSVADFLKMEDGQLATLEVLLVQLFDPFTSKSKKCLVRNARGKDSSGEVDLVFWNGFTHEPLKINTVVKIVDGRRNTNEWLGDYVDQMCTVDGRTEIKMFKRKKTVPKAPKSNPRPQIVKKTSSPDTMFKKKKLCRRPPDLALKLLKRDLHQTQRRRREKALLLKRLLSLRKQGRRVQRKM